MKTTSTIPSQYLEIPAGSCPIYQPKGERKQYRAISQRKHLINANSSQVAPAATESTMMKSKYTLALTALLATSCHAFITPHTSSSPSLALFANIDSRINSLTSSNVGEASDENQDMKFITAVANGYTAPKGVQFAGLRRRGNKSSTQLGMADRNALIPDGGLSPCVIKVVGVGGGGCNAVSSLV